MLVYCLRVVVVDVVDVEVVPDVPDVPVVPDVDVIVVSVDIVPVVPVMDVSVQVEDVSVTIVDDVSVTAEVSVMVVFSSFLQPNANTARAATMRKTSTFFI